MELTEDQIIQKMVERLEIVFEICYFHMIWMGLALIVS